MHWAELYLSRSRVDVNDWLVDMGVEWTDVRREEGNSVPRWHRPKDLGAGLVARMYERAVKSGDIDWRFVTLAKGLVKKKDGRVFQVAAVTGEREAEETSFDATAVIVATGGFCSNYEMVKKYSSRLAGIHFLVGGGPNAVGRGHHLIEDIGGQFVSLEDIWIYPFATPDPRDPREERGIVLRGMENAI